MKKLREFIWERCQADDKATDEIISAIEGLVPSEEELLKFIQSKMGGVLPTNREWMLEQLAKDCREEMLRRVNG